MSETIADKLVRIAENEVKLYEKTFGKGYVQGREKGYKEGYDDGLAVSKPEDLSDVLNEQEEKIATLSAILDKKASGGGNNNLKEYFEGATTDLYWDDVEKLIGSAFAKQSMTSASFSTLKEVGTSAFEQCSALASIEMPEVTNILGSAFLSCGNLALTELPPKLFRIVFNAFENCTSLAITHIPASVGSIMGSAFKNCSGLTSITFKGTPNSIANTVFSGCTNLTTINVPWAEGEVGVAPWGAPNVNTINYNHKGG